MLKRRSARTWGSLLGLVVAGLVTVPARADLPELKKRGVLRHLGIPYANFVTGSGDGMDVELLTQFARHLGVKYVYVATTWDDAVADLIGQRVRAKGDEVKVLGPAPVRGDVVANGFTILPWRQKVVDFSIPTFPTQVWLVARADSPLKPIKPSGILNDDIAAVKALLRKRTLLGKAKTCLDPSLYRIKDTGAKVTLFKGGLSELAAAVLNNDAEATLLDVPDALIALETWPGKLKIIGPISEVQMMGAAFTKDSPKLRAAFNAFLARSQKDGLYGRLVRKYYPAVYRYYPDFFAKAKER